MYRVFEGGWEREARELISYTNQNIREQIVLFASAPSEKLDRFSIDTMRFYTQIVRGKLEPIPPSEAVPPLESTEAETTETIKAEVFEQEQIESI